MSRRVALVAFLSLAALAAGAVYYAARVDPDTLASGADPSRLPVLADSVPALDAAKGWLNSRPLTPDDLAGKVVVYDFWTYSCVNCVRTLPHLRAWYERYADDGLVIVGVHSPEFEFERDHANVADAVDDLDVTWPVAFDDDMVIWAQFENRYWPAKYVTDRQGRLRFSHFGEGAYERTEDVIRSLLGVPDDAPRAAVGGDDGGAASADQTPELYLGDRRGRLAGSQELELGSHDFTRPDDIAVDEVALDGRWEVTDEYVESGARGATIVLHYRGSEVNLVMDAAEAGTSAVDVEVRLDGDRVDTVTVDGPRLYRLVSGGPAGEHVLEVEAVGAGVRAYAFTFGT